jgi:N-acetyl-anhydromuramyl-L-alanine amidase AmpD
MNIDTNSFKLPDNNYVPINTIKKQIIIGNTFNSGMKHLTGWLNRHNGNFKKTSQYSITKEGVIYQHFDPQFTSNYFSDNSLNSKSIIILLENEGWLKKYDKDNKFITWLGDIYNEPDNVVEKKWRSQKYWVKYTDEQLESLIELVIKLCDEFNINRLSYTTNTKIDDFSEDVGVLFKSNLNKKYTDLSPAFNFEYFNNKIIEIGI